MLKQEETWRITLTWGFTCDDLVGYRGRRGFGVGIYALAPSRSCQIRKNNHTLLNTIVEMDLIITLYCDLAYTHIYISRDCLRLVTNTFLTTRTRPFTTTTRHDQFHFYKHLTSTTLSKFTTILLNESEVALSCSEREHIFFRQLSTPPALPAPSPPLARRDPAVPSAPPPWLPSELFPVMRTRRDLPPRRRADHLF